MCNVQDSFRYEQPVLLETRARVTKSLSMQSKKPRKWTLLPDSSNMTCVTALGSNLPNLLGGSVMVVSNRSIILVCIDCYTGWQSCPGWRFLSMCPR